MIEYLLVDLDIDLPLEESTDPAEILDILQEIVATADVGDPLNIALFEYHPLLDADTEYLGVATIEAHLHKRIEARQRLRPLAFRVRSLFLLTPAAILRAYRSIPESSVVP